MTYQPKSYRKFVATAATATLVASAIAPAASAATFTDVSDRYKEAVDYLVENGVAQGTAEAKFGTADSIKRVDAAVMVARLLDLEDADAPDAGFTDVPDRGQWAVNALKEKGIINGKTATSFGSQDSMTRAEMAKVIANAYELTGSEDLPFTDVSATFETYVKAIFEAGITQGKTDTQFGSNQDVTRGEFALFVHRAEMMEDEVVAPEVTSVSAINATEVVVDFSVLVDKDSAETEANYAIGANNPSSATLNADKKSVTLKFADATQVEVDNAVFVVEPVKTAADTSVETAKFTKVFSYEDTVRPMVSGVSYPSNSSSKVMLSEAVKATDGADLEQYITITDSKGNDVSDSGLYTLATDKKSFAVNTASFTKDETYTLSIVGLKDLGDNLISPNPAVVSIIKTEVDALKPKVESVTALDTDKFKVVFSEAIDTSSDYFTYSVDGAAAVVVNSGNATMNEAKTEFTVNLGSALSAGPHSIAIDAYADPSSNDGDAFSKLINFQADTTNPSVVSTSIETVSNVRYVAVKFSEEVTLTGADLDFSFVQDGVLNSGTIDSSALSLSDLDEDGMNETVLINTEDYDGSGAKLKSGEYTISLPAALVTDTSQNTNDNTASSVKVTLGDLTSTDTTKPGISSIASQASNNNTIEVTFSEEVSNETALNLANYTIEGKQVFEKAVFIGDKKTVRLTLKEGAVKLNGDYQLEVMNIKDKAGNKMDNYTVTKPLTENALPALKTAVLTENDVITLTFSENMNVSSIEEALAEADFKVLVNGVEETGVTEASTDGKTFTLTLSDALTSAEYNSTISIKPTVDFDVEDANGNAHPTFDSVVVSK
ncbi:hypothetical protein CN378_10815 [Bacillus sp. AFS015802]|uniref:S-layer homology domain-containing protein n=1 Tax=Bacillus sp. AFS015802 TaxID=2033486 RepID=UPI000BF2F217|nr:S-layer homology domain-containing protein [Bacillus sp. AFS015802]PFA67330.1 hypothetical protein CN378_10815 [Bacillus sp. AFS015802]